MKAPKNLARLAYVAFAVTTFIISLYWTFPAQVVTMRAAQEVARATGGQVRIKVKTAELWRLTGIAAHDVEVQVGDGAPVRLDAARARLRMLPLFLLRRSIYVQVQLDQGLAEVLLSLDRGHDAEVKLDGVELARAPWLTRQLGFPMQGVISGTAALSGMPRWATAQGSIDFSIERMSLGPLSVEGINLPQIALGQLSLAMDITEGQAKITSFRQLGGNMSIETRGKVMLAEPLDASVLDVCARLKVDQGFLAANPKLNAAVQLAEVQIKRDPSGFLNVPLAGMVRAPQLRPGLCPPR